MHGDHDCNNLCFLYLQVHQTKFSQDWPCKAENDQCMTRDKNGEQQINCVSVTKPTIVYQFHV